MATGTTKGAVLHFLLHRSSCLVLYELVHCTTSSTVPPLVRAYVPRRQHAAIGSLAGSCSARPRNCSKALARMPRRSTPWCTHMHAMPLPGHTYASTTCATRIDAPHVGWARHRPSMHAVCGILYEACHMYGTEGAMLTVRSGGTRSGVIP